MRTFGGLAVLVSVLAMHALPASAQFQFTTLDHPLAGQGGTAAYDVDGNRIVGTFFDAAGASHGFVYDGATWSVLDHPDAALPRGTTAFGVSDGIICGTFVDAAGRTFGYTYDGLTWTTLARPPLGAGPVDTFARGVSDGTVVGYSIEGAVARGFVYNNGAFSDLVVPGAVGTFPDDTDSARIVGHFEDLIATHGFIVAGGLPIPIDFPLEPAVETSLTGVDGTNIVGNYLALLDPGSHGFLYDGTRFITIDFPGAVDTTVNGIGDNRIVGSYSTAPNVTHGFVAVIPEPAGAATTVMGAAALVRRPSRRRRVIHPSLPTPPAYPAVG